MTTLPSITKAPVYAYDRSPLAHRVCYNFRDYGFETAPGLADTFEVVPTRLTEEECFLFFFSRDDVAADRWALFNLHVFLKRTGSIQDFVHSMGESVATIRLSPTTAFHKPAVGYTRTITMRDLFKGGEAVIAFIGGEADRVVRDSHSYFGHRHCHCYTGVLHSPGEEARYDALRELLFDLVRFLD